MARPGPLSPISEKTEPDSPPRSSQRGGSSNSNPAPLHPQDAPLPGYITHPNHSNLSVRPPPYTLRPNSAQPPHPQDAPLPSHITPPGYSPHLNGSTPPPGYSPHTNGSAPLPAYSPHPNAPPPSYSSLHAVLNPPAAPRPSFSLPVARSLIVRTPTSRQPPQQPYVEHDDDDMEEQMGPGTRRRGGGKPVKRQGSAKKGDNKRAKLEKKKEEAWNDPEKVLGDGNCETYQDSTNVPAIINHPKAQDVLQSRDLSTSFTPCDVTNFKQDGKLGWHDPAYLSEAAVASEKRAASEFAELEKERFKEDWGEGEEEYSD